MTKKSSASWRERCCAGQDTTSSQLPVPRRRSTWYRAHPHETDLVIIDMVMPGKDGQECFKALKAIDPDVRAILSTGYGLDGHAQDALDAGMVGYVQKPYHMEDLVTAVADALADELT